MLIFIDYKKFVTITKMGTSLERSTKRVKFGDIAKTFGSSGK